MISASTSQPDRRSLLARTSEQRFHCDVDGQLRRRPNGLRLSQQRTLRRDFIKLLSRIVV